MRRHSMLILAVLTTLLLGGQTPLPLQRGTLEQGLDALAKCGITYRFLSSDLIELTDPVSSEKHLKMLREPNEAQIRVWADTEGIPLIEIDPNTIDTSQYTGGYIYWTAVPLGNSFGNPLIIGDLDHNGFTEAYGAYQDTLSFEYRARVYQIDSLGIPSLVHEFVPRPGVSRQITDADGDSLLEVTWSLAGVVAGYEQISADSLPIRRTYAHDRFYLGHQTSSTGIYFGDLDGDNIMDLLYQGTEPDSLDTNEAVSKTYVAEYNSSVDSFERVWSTQFYPNSGAHGFAVGDFDNSGLTDFVATHATGRVYVAENNGDNEYSLVWQDTIPFVNLYDLGSGDIDNDSKEEFFAGAVMSNGSWILTYEADSNGTYSPRVLFHLLSGGLLTGVTYTATDMDGDGLSELSLAIGSDLYVFKSSVDNEYFLWYFKRENRMEAIAFYDFDRNDRVDFICSKRGINSQGRSWFYADIYLASKLVDVKGRSLNPPIVHLLQAYPNPFNASASIEYVIDKRRWVTLKIYDVLGQEIATLVSGEVDVGRHSVVWNAAGFSSGVYFCRLEAEGVTFSRKLLLIR